LLIADSFSRLIFELQVATSAKERWCAASMTVSAHRLAVAAGQDEGGFLARLRADGAPIPFARRAAPRAACHGVLRRVILFLPDLGLHPGGLFRRDL
jgi:hypothetical protein